MCVCVWGGGGGGGALFFWFAKLVRMIVGECEQREVCKRYNVAGNGPDSEFETIYHVN